jgi:hypothetical protein
MKLDHHSNRFSCVNMFHKQSYIMGHKMSEQSLISVYSVYPLSTDGLIWMFDVGIYYRTWISLFRF